MGQNNQKLEKIIEAISENTGKELTIRHLSNLTKIPKTSLNRYINMLKKSKIVDDKNKIITNNHTRFLRSSIIIKKLFTTGLIEYLEMQLVPSVIIVFGSIRKGEYVKESDIDIFVEATKNVELDLVRFEKKLKHKIQLFIRQDINDLPKELFNSVVNGIKLSGYLKLRN